MTDHRNKLEGNSRKLADRMLEESPETIPNLKDILYPEFKGKYSNKQSFKRVLHNRAKDLEEADEAEIKKVAGKGSMKNTKLIPK